MGEALKLSRKQRSFGNREALDRKIILHFPVFKYLAQNQEFLVSLLKLQMFAILTFLFTNLLSEGQAGE